ncbi:prostatic spermine-binding protein-like [Leptopilina boulardi]|uniref:prostatic spermine-binding protein-like n=1 Tax=Leptopilina boulardi TaxID=63433 RepID=UPI0021F5FC19|nr:prostatic spermine-binding protein-like [Leptopilina boulardi]
MDQFNHSQNIEEEDVICIFDKYAHNNYEDDDNVVDDDCLVVDIDPECIFDEYAHNNFEDAENDGDDDDDDEVDDKYDSQGETIIIIDDNDDDCLVFNIDPEEMTELLEAYPATADILKIIQINMEIPDASQPPSP